MNLCKSLLLWVFCFSFTACGVELRNSHSPDTEAPDLIVDGPMYVYQGKVIAEDDFNAFIENADADSETDTSDVTPAELKFRNIQISENGVLYTLGQNVHLVADTLNSEEGGVITTFKEKQKASQGHAGRSGGQLVLEIQQAQGSLRVEMRGESGGQGLPGEDPDDALNGADGAPGADLGVTVVGNVCSVRGNDGGDGQPGKAGYPGHPGFVGGDSGELQLEIQDMGDFSYDIVKIPGEGGLGGPGGRGGDGGQGGAPGKAYCPRAIGNSGNQAPDGLVGPAGVQGASGRKQPACIMQDNVMNCR